MTRFLSREVYGEIDPITLDRAAEKGTVIHKATQELDETGKTEVPSEYEGYLEAYLKFREEHQVTWWLIEYRTNYGKEYAGTIDRYGMLDGDRVILDIKTGKTISKPHKTLYTAAQNLYRMAMDSEGLVSHKLYILHLKPNGTYKLIELPFDVELPMACLKLHKAMQASRTRKKK